MFDRGSSRRSPLPTRRASRQRPTFRPPTRPGTGALLYQLERVLGAQANAPRTLAISLPYSSLERDFCRRRLARQKGSEDDVSAQRPEIGDHRTREMAAKRLFCQRAISCGFRKTGWWGRNRSKLGAHHPVIEPVSNLTQGREFSMQRLGDKIGAFGRCWQAETTPIRDANCNALVCRLRNP